MVAWLQCIVALNPKYTEAEQPFTTPFLNDRLYFISECPINQLRLLTYSAVNAASVYFGLKARARVFQLSFFFGLIIFVCFRPDCPPFNAIALVITDIIRMDNFHTGGHSYSQS